MMGHICTLLIGMVESHHGDAGVSRVFQLSGVERRHSAADLVITADLRGGIANSGNALVP